MRKPKFKLYLLIVFCLFIPIIIYAQTNKKLNLSLKEKPLKEFFKVIESQTEFTFMYNNIDLNQKVTIEVKQTSLDNILKTVLTPLSLTYEVRNRQILIKNVSLAPIRDQSIKTITGTVTDERDEPIIGANVVERGTTNGVTTDMDGKFTLSVIENATLQFSYIGYASQEISVRNQKLLNIMLREDNLALEEVVVVGYGTMKKKDMTGAVSTIKGESLATRKTTQLSTALQGAAAGVLVTRNNNAPGATASIKIRGVTTISDTEPLIIIDGVPGNINLVNPEDVESVSILKDAASASIYGSRAAAGVIVITTKRASENSFNMSYNFEYGLEIPTQLPEYTGVQRFLEMTNELRYNDNNAGGWYQTYTEDEVNNWLKYNKTDSDRYPNTDWQDVLLKSSAPRQTHSISLSGGSKNVGTKASFRYDKTDGLYVNRNYERYMVRINNDININKYFQGRLDINFRRSESVNANANPLNVDWRRIPPIYAAKWSNGMWGDVKDGSNTLAVITDGGTNTNWYSQIGGKAALDFTPINGLKISAVVAPVYNFNKTKTFVKQVPYTYADDPNTNKGYMVGFFTTNLTEKRNDDYNITTQFFANYEKTLGKNNFTAMVGYEDYYAFWENLSASREQYLLNNYPYLDVGPETYRDNGGNAYEYAYRSFFGRVTYNFDNRYMFQANLRRDGSSRFEKNYRWGSFPSFSAGWTVSEESFVKKLNWKWLSYTKIRASWGTLGNERIGSYYPYQSSMSFGTALHYSGNEVIPVNTAYQGVYAVRNITWETTEAWNIGLDASFLDGRLRFTGEYYKKKTKDMLLNLEIPSFIGYNNPSVNAGKMHTTGYDIEMGWHDRIGDFSYSVSANLSDFISKMGDLKGTQFLGDKVKIAGSQFDEWYGYISDGLFLTQEDLDNSPQLNNNTKIGDVKYRDISGPDGVPDGIISSEYDRVLLGGSLPRYTYGVNIGASYKGFDISMIIQGVGKQKSRIWASMVEGLAANWGNFPTLIDGKYWSSLNSDEQNSVAKYPRLTRSNRDANMASSDFWLFNGRYFRMKNITLGYTLPKTLTKKVSIDMLRFYVAGSDLFCLSSFPKGWDPEVDTQGYPITTSVVFGISVNF